jgi:hypothetical protein
MNFFGGVPHTNCTPQELVAFFRIMLPNVDRGNNFSEDEWSHCIASHAVDDWAMQVWPYITLTMPKKTPTALKETLELRNLKSMEVMH